MRKRLVVEFGMGTDLQGQDYTKAAVRALRDALWHNSLTIAPALGFSRDAMQVDIEVGVARPEAVDPAALAAVLPYGQSRVLISEGGLDVLSNSGASHTVIANAAAVVYLDIEAGVESDAHIDAADSATPRAAAAGGATTASSAPATPPGTRQIILEMGTGNDLYGEDYTKACRRAVQDALHHSSLILFRSLDIDHQLMNIHLSLGVQLPDAVDTAAVAADVPFGTVTASARLGGLNVVDPDNGTTTVIATAALAVYLPVAALESCLAVR